MSPWARLHTLVSRVQDSEAHGPLLYRRWLLWAAKGSFHAQGRRQSCLKTAGGPPRDSRGQQAGLPMPRGAPDGPGPSLQPSPEPPPQTLAWDTAPQPGPGHWTRRRDEGPRLISNQPRSSRLRESRCHKGMLSECTAGGHFSPPPQGTSSEESLAWACGHERGPQGEGR